MVLAGRNDYYVTLRHCEGLVVVSDSASTFGDHQDLVAGGLVEFVPRTSVEGDDG